MPIQFSKFSLFFCIFAHGAMVLTGCGSGPSETASPTATKYAFLLTALPGPFTLFKVENLFEIVATEADPPLDPLLLRVSIGELEKTPTLMAVALTGDARVGDKWGKDGTLTITEPSAGYLERKSLGVTYDVTIQVLTDSNDGTGVVTVGALTWTPPIPDDVPTN